MIPCVGPTAFSHRIKTMSNDQDEAFEFYRFFLSLADRVEARFPLVFQVTRTPCLPACLVPACQSFIREFLDGSLGALFPREGGFKPWRDLIGLGDRPDQGG